MGLDRRDDPVEGDAQVAGDGDSTSVDGDSAPGDGDSTSGDGDSTSGDGDSTSGDGDSASGDGDQTMVDGGGGDVGGVADSGMQDAGPATDAATPMDAAQPMDAGQSDAMVDAGSDCDLNADPLTEDTDGDGILDIFDPDDDGDGVDDVTECFAQPPQLFVNNGFESPAVTLDFEIIDQSLVPAWFTTAPDGQIEIWPSGKNGVDAAEGAQFAECNANMPGALYQDLTTIPGTTVRWAFYHRGRGGTDTLDLRIGPPTGTLSQGMFSTSNADWALYTGTYDVPAGQTVTRFEYNCEAQAGSVGNFLDAAYMEPVCTVDTDGDGCPDSKDP